MSITPATPSLLDDELKSHTRRRWAVAVIVLVLALIFVPPFIRLNRLKASLGSSLSASLGRQVKIGTITLRLLPRPGFDLSDVDLQDDPAFSAEPMLHADTVTASLRLSSLWRGRMEIASLSFQNPSVNLVRDQEGRWNVASLLARAQQIPTAPTTKAISESRPRFPYLEANGARINFKIGMEKKAYGFSEADAALWLAAENEWHIRMEARPVRSDRNLHDTGVVRLDGTFQRSSEPRQTPLRLDLALENGQLGQISEFVYGRDRGWRGGLDVNATVAGTPSELQLTLNATLDDFRRYDITGSDSSRIRARCTATYSDAPATPQSLHGIDCRMPAGNGEVAARGSVQQIFRSPRYELSIAVSHLPGAVLASAARRMKKGVIADLNASGEANAAFTVKSGESADAPPVIAGGGELRDLRLKSRSIQPELALGELQFGFDRTEVKPTARGKKRGPQDAATAPVPTLRISSIPISLGTAPNRVLYVEGAIRPTDFSLSLRGQADLERALPIAQALGFNVPRSAITGIAEVNATLNGVGKDFSEPWLAGKISLTGIKVRGGPLPAAVSVDYATAEFTRDRTDFWMQEAILAGSTIRVRGTISFIRACGADICPLHFQLSSNELRLEELNGLLTGQVDRPWYSFGRHDSSAGMSTAGGEGTLNIGRLLIRSATFSGFSGFLRYGDGKLDLTNITADVGSGKHLGELHATFGGDAPQYDLAGTVTRASLDAVGSSFLPAGWRSSPARGGTLDAKYRLHLSGLDAAALFKSAEGAADLVWTNGSFTGHADNGAARTLDVRELSDRVSWTNGALQILPADLQTSGGVLQISGTFARSYDLRIQSNGKPLLVAFGTMNAAPPETAKK